jgi:chaperonin GroES
MKVTPIGDKVVVRRLDAEEKTPGGILLPDAAKQKPQEGRVLSVGDGRLIAGGKRAPNQVREGDKVVFLTYAGTEVSVDDDDLLILREEDILAVID